ncbi:hypothetical protein [Roseicyclus elongatus]|uniref:hypothetical protein n=1 Tax=Roseicyclus elongatus TaxID=159346 RepID=UPI00316ADD58
MATRASAVARGLTARQNGLIGGGRCQFGRLDRHGRPDAARQQILLAFQRTQTQIGLALRRGDILAREVEGAGRLGQFILGIAQVGGGGIAGRLRLGRVDAQQELPRLDRTAILDIHGQFDHRALGGGPQFQRTPRPHLAKGSQNRNLRPEIKGQDLGRKDALARGRCAGLFRHAVLQGAPEGIRRDRQDRKRRGQQEQARKGAAEKTHVFVPIKRCQGIR